MSTIVETPGWLKIGGSEGGSSLLGTGLFVQLACIYFAWRIYRFTIAPMLDPTAPPELPYNIPFIGHAWKFFMNFGDALDLGRRHFKNTHEIYAVTCAGDSMYVISDPRDAASVWKQTEEIGMQPVVRDIYAIVGLSQEGADKMFEKIDHPKYGKNMTMNLVIVELHKKQLWPGEVFDPWHDNVFAPNLKRSTGRLSSLPSSTTLSSPNSWRVSLDELTVDAFVDGLIIAYYGQSQFDKGLTVGLNKYYHDWETTNWKVMFGLPKVICGDALKARDGMVGIFKKYYSTPREERSDAAWFTLAMEDHFRNSGMGDRELACIMTLTFWAIVSNIHKIAFYLVAEMVFAPETHAAIKKEVLAAFIDGDENRLDGTILDDHCPTLDSLWMETLRTGVASAFLRQVIQDTTVGGKQLKAGRKLVVPLGQLHAKRSVWGSEPEKVQPTRFLDHPLLSRNNSYKPWGGGSTMCPGRFFAKRFVFTYMAHLLKKYDLEVASGEKFPPKNTAIATPGATHHAEDLFLKVTARSS